jgi:predicted alpha/beta-hydrolase family hydrolase
VLGHGAGGGVESRDLLAVAEVVVRAGGAVVLVEQPWRVAGGRIAPRPAVLDLAWIEALAALRPRGPLVVGGRSAGARVACRTAADVGADGVLCLAFPLHPPGRPERSRASELRDCPVPTLVIQGERDAFGRPEEIRAAVRGRRVVAVAGADHGLARGDLAPALAEISRFVFSVRD